MSEFVERKSKQEIKNGQTLTAFALMEYLKRNA